jgi:arginase
MKKINSLNFLEKNKAETEVSFLGIPLDIGKNNSGTDSAPDFIRDAGLKKMLESVGVKYKDLGNLDCPKRENSVIGDKKVRYLKEISETAEKIAKIVSKEISSGRKFLALGGDHSISIGTIAGASDACKGDLGLIWIDAHADAMTHENTLTGNIHGMPSAVAMGFGHKNLVHILKPGKKVDPKNVLYIGLKDLDQGEIDLIKKEKISAITIMDIVADGLKNAFEEIEALSKRVSKIWVSLDVDSIDEEFSPATPMPNSGGLTYREITNMCRYIGKKTSFVGADIVEICPRLDVGDKTKKLTLELIAYLLGGEYNWYTQYMNEEESK